MGAGREFSCPLRACIDLVKRRKPASRRRWGASASHLARSGEIVNFRPSTSVGVGFWSKVRLGSVRTRVAPSFAQDGRLATITAKRRRAASRSGKEPSDSPPIGRKCRFCLSPTGPTDLWLTHSGPGGMLQTIAPGGTSTGARCNRAYAESTDPREFTWASRPLV
jgi:hypothetical protein